MVSIDSYLDQLYRESLSKLKANRDKDADMYYQELRKRLPDLLGGFPPTKPELRPVVLESAEYEGLQLEKVEYTTLANMRTSAYVLIPARRERPLPAVLACHGHGRGHKDALALAADGALSDQPGIHNKFAVQLAQRGMLVIVPEILGFGERRLQADMEEDPDGGRTSCFRIAVQLMMQGRTLAGYRVFEAIRALDFLETRPEADPGRMGVIGFSGGGLVGSFTAALDERVRATVICGYANTFKGSILSRPHCIDNYIPGLLEHAEQPDVLGLIAPRALFIEAGENDRTFPVAYVREALEHLQPVYDRHQAGDRLDSDIFPGRHEISGRKSFDWLQSQLAQ